jgi:hypothetical protein
MSCGAYSWLLFTSVLTYWVWLVPCTTQEMRGLYSRPRKLPSILARAVFWYGLYALIVWVLYREGVLHWYWNYWLDRKNQVLFILTCTVPIAISLLQIAAMKVGVVIRLGPCFSLRKCR